MKRALVASISLLVLALAFGVVAVLQTIEAKKNAIEAKKNADKALTQTKLAEAEKEKAEAAQVYAETNALLARKAEKNAEAEKEKAEKARKQAEESALIARNAEIQAKLSEEIAKSERKKAEKNLATAIAARKKAKEEEEKATIAKVQADRERQKAKAKELAFKSIQSFNNEDETATKATLALYAYENYQDSTKTFHQDPDIYSALRLALEKIDKNIASGINANQGGIKSLVLVDTQVLTAGSTGSIKMWDLTEDNTLIKPSEEAFSFAKNGTHLTKHIATNIDNTLMASSHADGKIRVWKAQNIESELPFNKKGFIELKGHEYPVKLTAFAKDGKSLLSLDTEGNVFFWELKEDIGLTQKPQKLDFEKGEGFKTISILPTNEDNKFLLGVNEDGDGILAEITITDAKIESYTIKNGSFNPIQSMVLNPNGDKLAIGSRFGDIDILDFRTFNKIESLNSHKNGVVSIAFSPDGKHMVSAGFDKTVQLFNMESLKANPVLIRNNSWVRTVTFNPNSEQFFTSGEDERIHVYDVRSKVMATKLKAKLEKALESEETKENVKAQLEETFGKDSGVYQYFKNDFLKLEQMTKF